MFDFEVYELVGDYKNINQIFLNLPFKLPEEMEEATLYCSEFQNHSSNKNIDNYFSLIKKNVKINTKIVKAHMRHEFDNYCEENGLSYVPKDMRKQIEKDIKEKLKLKNSYYVLDTVDIILNNNKVLFGKNDHGLGDNFLKLIHDRQVKIQEPNEKVYINWQSKFYEFLDFAKKDVTETYIVEKIIYAKDKDKATLTNSFAKESEYEDSCDSITIKSDFGKITLFSKNPFRAKVSLGKGLDKSSYYEIWNDMTSTILGI